MAKTVNIPGRASVLKAMHSAGSSQQGNKLLVLMVHDFPGSREGNHALFADIEALLAEENIHSLRYDARGCGESESGPGGFTLDSACQDFQSVLNWADQEGYERFLLIGEGVGATVCLINLSFNVVAQALFWPVLQPPEWVRQGILPPDAGPEFVRQMQKTDLTGVLQDVVTPTLIMHGVEDKTVPVSQLDHARRHMRSKRIEITTFHDGEHGLHKLNHRKAVFFHLMQFVEKYI